MWIRLESAIPSLYNLKGRRCVLLILSSRWKTCSWTRPLSFPNITKIAYICLAISRSKKYIFIVGPHSFYTPRKNLNARPYKQSHGSLNRNVSHVKKYKQLFIHLSILTLMSTVLHFITSFEAENIYTLLDAPQFTISFKCLLNGQMKNCEIKCKMHFI